jgi:hypothetical protein
MNLPVIRTREEAKQHNPYHPALVEARNAPGCGPSTR